MLGHVWTNAEPNSNPNWADGPLSGALLGGQLSVASPPQTPHSQSAATAASSIWGILEGPNTQAEVTEYRMQNIEYRIT